MSKITVLPQNIITEISKFITDKSSNITIAENIEIFELLERYCIVVYYPLPENEENDGFHIKRSINGKLENIVFINTQKYNEKQIFTAAHELGHIMELDKHLIEKELIRDDDVDLQEAAMNQFAAQFLMREPQFRQCLWECQKGKTAFTEIEFVNIVLCIMEKFSVPFKSVLWRLAELSIITEDTGNVILEKYKNQIPELIKQLSYKNLGQRSCKKLIRGYDQLLNDAERLECFSESDLSNIREDFSIIKTPCTQNTELKIDEASNANE